jgi:hypothetical protein
MVGTGVVLTDYEMFRRTEEHHPTGRIRVAGTVLAVTLAAALPSTPGCSFAVNHPSVATGVVGGTLGLATCKLASDDIGACLAVGGGAGAFLGLVAAAALLLGGDGHTVMTEEQAQPLPEDDRPRRRRRKPLVDPAASDADPAAAEPDQPPASPDPASPDPASPDPASPERTPRARTP